MPSGSPTRAPRRLWHSVLSRDMRLVGRRCSPKRCRPGSVRHNGRCSKRDDIAFEDERAHLERVLDAGPNWLKESSISPG